VALEADLTEAVKAAWEEGCPVAGGDPEKKARIALRRWRSFERRRGTDRVEDLAKGLRDHFEADPREAGPLMEDYRYLASCLASVLERGDE
jgi:hypothetical protein